MGAHLRGTGPNSRALEGPEAPKEVDTPWLTDAQPVNTGVWGLWNEGKHPHFRPRPFRSNRYWGSGARLSENPIERTLQRWCVGAFIEALEPALASREPGV